MNTGVLSIIAGILTLLLLIYVNWIGFETLVNMKLEHDPTKGIHVFSSGGLRKIPLLTGLIATLIGVVAIRGKRKYGKMGFGLSLGLTIISWFPFYTLFVN